jgi:hypothetical protein
MNRQASGSAGSLAGIQDRIKLFRWVVDQAGRRRSQKEMPTTDFTDHTDGEEELAKFIRVIRAIRGQSDC